MSEYMIRKIFFNKEGKIVLIVTKQAGETSFPGGIHYNRIYEIDRKGVIKNISRKTGLKGSSLEKYSWGWDSRLQRVVTLLIDKYPDLIEAEQAATIPIAKFNRIRIVWEKDGQTFYQLVNKYNNSSKFIAIFEEDIQQFIKMNTGNTVPLETAIVYKDEHIRQFLKRILLINIY